MFGSVSAKLAKMRKEQSFTVYPWNGTGPIKVQSDRAIGQFDPVTGEGILNWRGSNSKYNHDLMAIRGAEAYTFPQWFVDECKKVAPRPSEDGTVRIL